MKKLLLLLWVFLGFQELQAQKTILYGTVRDSLGVAMQQANIMVFNPADSSVTGFAFADNNGDYVFELNVNQVYLLKCSYLGFKTFKKQFTVSTDSIGVDVILYESSFTLKGVEIVEDFPVTISGDTISYKSDAFSNGQERKLGEVINNLPGFDVDKNGQVTVHGKAVETILIDGKEFFGGDTKLAVQNIPADVVDRIDLVTNYNENELLKGLDNGDKMAINIQLKEGKKNIWFGDVEMGAGVENKYLTHPNVFHFSPKTNINFIGDLNNIGQQAFSLQDYLRFSGGLDGLSNGGSSLTMVSDDEGLTMMQNDRAFQSTSSLAAFNINHNPNKKWQFSGFGIVNASNTDINSWSIRSYLRQYTNQTEINESDVKQNLKSVLAKVTAKYKPSSTLQIGYNGLLKASEMEDKDNRYSTFGGVPNNILENNARSPFSLDQKLDIYKTIGTRTIISGKINWLYKKQHPFYALLTENKPLDGILPLVPDLHYSIHQNQEIISNNMASEIDYYFLVNPRNHLKFTLGLNKVSQSFNSKITQQLNTGTVEDLPQGFANDTRYSFLDSYFGMQYRGRFGKLTISPGLNLHVYQNTISQLHTNDVINKKLVLPDLYTRYAFSKTKNLVFNYNINANFTDILNLSEGARIRNYTSLFTGNSGLKNMWYHNLSLSYMSFSMFHHTNLFFIINYQKRYDDINQSVIYQDINRLSIPTNARLSNEMLMAMGSFEKKYQKWKYRLGLELNYSNFQNSIEFVTNRNTTFTQTYKISAETNFNSLPNLELGMESKWSDYSSSGTRQLFLNNAPFANLEVVLPQGFLVSVEYIYTDYRSTTNNSKSKYDFLNAAIYYRKKGSVWEFKLSSKNILNTEYIRKDQFNDNVISTYQYYVQPSYTLLSVKYDL